MLFPIMTPIDEQHHVEVGLHLRQACIVPCTGKATTIFAFASGGFRRREARGINKCHVWHKRRCYTTFMTHVGFKVGRVTPGTFWHANTDMVADVHGDDFTYKRSEGSLQRFKQELNAKFERTQ